MISDNYALNLFISVVVIGIAVGELVSCVFICLYEKLMYWPKEGLSWKDRIVVHSTGIFERGVYMILLVSNLSAAGAFIGTWILAKVITGWNARQAWMEDEAKRFKVNRRSFVSLQGSLVSLFFALLGAWLWCPNTF